MELAEQLIAKQLRELRKQKRLTLQRVTERAGISKSFLSKVEHHVSISGLGSRSSAKPRRGL